MKKSIFKTEEGNFEKQASRADLVRLAAQAILLHINGIDINWVSISIEDGGHLCSSPLTSDEDEIDEVWINGTFFLGYSIAVMYDQNQSINPRDWYENALSKLGTDYYDWDGGRQLLREFRGRNFRLQEERYGYELFEQIYHEVYRVIEKPAFWDAIEGIIKELEASRFLKGEEIHDYLRNNLPISALAD